MEHQYSSPDFFQSLELERKWADMVGDCGERALRIEQNSTADEIVTDLSVSTTFNTILLNGDYVSNMANVISDTIEMTMFDSKSTDHRLPQLHRNQATDSIISRSRYKPTGAKCMPGEQIEFHKHGEYIEPFFCNPCQATFTDCSSYANHLVSREHRVEVGHQYCDIGELIDVKTNKIFVDLEHGMCFHKTDCLVKSRKTQDLSTTNTVRAADSRVLTCSPHSTAELSTTNTLRAAVSRVLTCSPHNTAELSTTSTVRAAVSRVLTCSHHSTAELSTTNTVRAAVGRVLTCSPHSTARLSTTNTVRAAVSRVLTCSPHSTARLSTTNTVRAAVSRVLTCSPHSTARLSTTNSVRAAVSRVLTCSPHNTARLSTTNSVRAAVSMVLTCIPHNTAEISTTSTVRVAVSRVLACSPHSTAELSTTNTVRATVSRVLTCIACDLFFDTEKALDMHCETNGRKNCKASENDNYQACEIPCHRSGSVQVAAGETNEFSAAGSEVQSIDEMEDDTCQTQRYECKICWKEFSRKYELAYHLLTPFHFCRAVGHPDALRILHEHSRSVIRLLPFQCNVCHFFFTRRGDLVRHMEGEEHQAKCSDLVCPMICVGCNFKSGKHTDMLEHARSHPIKPSARNKQVCVIRECHSEITCPFCGVQMRSAVRMKRHVEFRHRGQQVSLLIGWRFCLV